MQDLILAKLILKKKNLTLVAVKGGSVIFETSSHSITGFLQAIEMLGKELIGSSVADKTVGRAVALLCVYSKIASVFAATISEDGIRVLEANNIFCKFKNKVPRILNHAGTDTCPFEKLTTGLTNPMEAYERLKAFGETSIPNNLDLQ